MILDMRCPACDLPVKGTQDVRTVTRKTPLARRPDRKCACKHCNTLVELTKGEEDGITVHFYTVDVPLTEIMCEHEWDKPARKGETRTCCKCGGKQTN